MSFYHIKIPRADLIFGGLPSTPLGVSKELYACIYSKRISHPFKRSIKEEARSKGRKTHYE
jgi:hypothetical protein